MWASRFRHLSLGWLAVGSAALLWAAYYGHLALRKHRALVTGVDLADVDQAMWWTLLGAPLRITTFPDITNRLGIHVEPLLLALVPLYALRPGAETLIVVQVLVLASGALPLYGLARHLLDDGKIALLFPLLYLLAPAVHNAALSDFYPVLLGVPLAVLSTWAFERGRLRAGLLLAGLALLAREDFGLWLAGLAWYLRSRLGRKLWPLLAAGGVIWFLVATLLVVSLFTEAHRSPFWARYRFWVEAPTAWQRAAFLEPRLWYALRVLLMGGAGAVLAPASAVPAVPALLLNVAANFDLPLSFESHYNVLPVAVLLGASAAGFRRLPPTARHAGMAVALAAALWVHVEVGRSPLVSGFRPPAETRHSRAARVLAARVPAHVPLSVSAPLAPHVSRRPFLAVFPRLEGAEDVLVDVYADRTLHPLEMRRRVLNLLNEGWGPIAADHGVLWLSRRAPPAELPASFFTFVYPEHPPTYPTYLVFGDALELVGFDIFWDYWGRPAARLYWHPLKSLPDGWQPAALAQGEGGRWLATPDTHPPVVLLWWPVSRWKAGETYVVEMLPFDAPDRVTVLAGVGAPLTDPAARQRTADGRDLVPLATLVRRGRGWAVLPLVPPDEASPQVGGCAQPEHGCEPQLQGQNRGQHRCNYRSRPVDGPGPGYQRRGLAFEPHQTHREGNAQDHAQGRRGARQQEQPSPGARAQGQRRQPIQQHGRAGCQQGQRQPHRPPGQAGPAGHGTSHT